jgi:hypothetical protein
MLVRQLYITQLHNTNLGGEIITICRYVRILKVISNFTLHLNVISQHFALLAEKKHENFSMCVFERSSNHLMLFTPA